MSEFTEETASRKREQRERSEERRKPVQSPERPSWVSNLHATTGNRSASRLLARAPLAGMRISPTLSSPAIARLILRAEDEAAPDEEEEMLNAKHSDAALAQREDAPEEEDEEMVGAKHEPAALGAAGGTIDSASASRIDDLRGSGAPLGGDLQNTMESHFGADFSGVRVHQDGESDALAKNMSARAFTTGSDIFLRQSERAEDSNLMAHELTHVVQQAGGGTASTGRMAVGAANDPMEAEADREASLLASGGASRMAEEDHQH